MKKACEKCGMVTETEDTGSVGPYCLDCHAINIEESMEASRLIEERTASQPDDAEGFCECENPYLMQRDYKTVCRMFKKAIDA